MLIAFGNEHLKTTRISATKGNIIDNMKSLLANWLFHDTMSFNVMQCQSTVTNVMFS